MKTIRLGRTNKIVPSIGYGTWPHSGPSVINGRDEGWSGHDDKLARASLIKAYELGLVHWDTADIYGNGKAELLIGSTWIDVPRDEIFLASKVGWVSNEYHFYHPKQIRLQLEKSLLNLRTDYIDLYYFHHCDFGKNSEYLDDAVDLFQRFKSEGKILFTGLSDWNASHIVSHIDRVEPDVVQVFRTVIDDNYLESGLSRVVDEKDLGVVFFSAIRQGLLLGKYKDPPIFGKGDVRNEIPEFKDVDFLKKMRLNRKKIMERFPNSRDSVLHSLLNSLLVDTPTGAVLLGQRNSDQTIAAARVARDISIEDAEWVKELYL